MDERPRERTWLCSVVFVDIVHYSVQSVTLEMNWKARLNGYIAASIQDVPEADRVILDTGDGAAICFLGDPEAAMYCALRMLDSFVTKETGPVGMRVRIGVNVGPVKLVRDLNGNVNAIGDGINVGQRVMSFASENQILVSRSFYEVASRLSDSYAQLFRSVGTRKDKHVREHTLYELVPPGSPGTQPTTGPRAAATPGRRPEPAPAPGYTPAPTLDPVTAERIERILAGIVGPIARYLVRDAAFASQSPEDAVLALAAHVTVPEDQARFVEAAQAELAASAFADEQDEAPVVPGEPPVRPLRETPGRTPSAPASRSTPARTPSRSTPARTPSHATPSRTARSTPGSSPTRTPAPAPTSRGRAPTPSSIAPPPGWDAAVLDRITHELALFVGPVARVLVQRTAPAAADEVDLYQRLAAHVPTDKERASFLQNQPRPEPPEDPA